MTWRRIAAVACGAVALVVATAPTATAHPLGNATVSHYDGLRVFPRHVDDFAVEDIAEIPELQRLPTIDANGDGRLSAGERAAYAERRCGSLARGIRLSVGATRLAPRVTTAAFTERPGAIGLRIGRLTCRLSAPARIAAQTSVRVVDGWDGAGIGWHEITAVGSGVTLLRSPVPARSISDTLLRYPNNLLASPLDTRSATIAVVPGAAPSTYAAARSAPAAGYPTRVLGHVSAVLTRLAGARHLTVGVAILAVVLAMLLGAGHAFLPGHGKTVMAAYLVGRRGRLRDVVLVGATVTVTHTVGVLALGLAVSLSASFAPTAVEQDLGVVSGAIVALVGVGLLASAARRRRTARPAPVVAPEPVLVAAGHRAAGHRAAGDDAHEHDHPHPHPHGHSHAHPHPTGPGFSRSGLVGLGAAGGLVPSPSALLVLLGAAALGRVTYGVLLVLAYGAGMAGALTAAGLLLVRLRGRLAPLLDAERAGALGRLAATLPLVTATLVLLVGLGLMARALGGSV